MAAFPARALAESWRERDTLSIPAVYVRSTKEDDLRSSWSGIFPDRICSSAGTMLSSETKTPRLAPLEHQGQGAEWRRRLFQAIERIMNNIVAGQSETAQALDESELNLSLLVESTVDQLGANDPMGNVKIEFEIIGLAEMREGLPQSRADEFEREIRPQCQHMIAKKTFLQRVDPQPRGNRLNDKCPLRLRCGFLEAWTLRSHRAVRIAPTPAGSQDK